MKTYEVTDAQELKLKRAFTYHAPKDGQADKYTEIRELFLALSVRLHALAPESRELSVAMTHLETANMWANAAIARNE